jgi:hypothetical protein
MSYFNEPPAYNRYVQGPLSLVKRPVFWASAAGVLVVALGAWKYWNDPQWFNALLGNQAAESNKPIRPAVNAKLPTETAAGINTNPNGVPTPGTGIDRTTGLPSLNLPNPTPVPPSTAGLSPLTAQANSLSKPTQTNLNLGNSFSQKLNTSPFSTSSQFNPSSLGRSSGLTNFQASRPQSTSTATRNPAINFNALSSINKNSNPVAVSPLPARLSPAKVFNPATTVPPNQSSVNTQGRELPTLYSQGQIPFIPPTVPEATANNPSGGQITATPGSGLGITPAANLSPEQIAALTPGGVTAASDNAAVGRLPSPPAVPGVTGNNASPTTPTSLNSGALSAPSQAANQATLTAQSLPVAPVTLTEFGQYSSQISGQTNGAANPGFDSMLKNPGLKVSESNLPTFQAPPTMPGSDIWGQANTLSKQR